MVKTLGHEGMSSEESEVEDEINTVLRVKTLEWRRDIEKELGIIDSARVAGPRTFGKSGAKPMIRRRGDKLLLSKREPPTGLPRPFYDNAWFEKERNRARTLEVPDVRFKWMHIVT
jgi:hypothetical protein